MCIRDSRTDRTLTFADLIAEVETVAAGLAAAGISPGDRVATVLGNDLEHAVALLAAHRLGAVLCMINPRLKPDEAGALMSDGGVSSVICGAGGEIVSAAKAALPDGAPVFTHGGTVGDTTDLADCRGDAADLAPWQTPDRDECVSAPPSSSCVTSS